MMALRQAMVVGLALVSLTACATRATPPIADASCVTFKRISYAIPPVQPDGTRNMADDPGNAHDTVATIGEIQMHNARLQAVCG